MPIYEFTCLACEKTLAVSLPIDADKLLLCPDCGVAMKRSYTFGATTFKGSGFYRNDK